VRWFAVAVIAVAVQSCAGTSGSRHEGPLPSLSTDELLARVNARHSRIHTLEADGVLTIETPEKSGSTDFDLSLRKPDSLLLSVSGPFGIDLGTLLFTRSRYIFHNVTDHYAVAGRPDGSTMSTLFNIGLDFDQVLLSFTGEFTAAAAGKSGAAGAAGNTSTGDEGYILTYDRDGKTQEFRIDGSDYFVTSYRLLGADGRPELIATAEDPDDADGIVMPYLLRVVFPKERKSITVAYDGIGVNADVSCAYEVPKGVEVHER
jgi:hypothetical protein